MDSCDFEREKKEEDGEEEREGEEKGEEGELGGEEAREDGREKRVTFSILFLSIYNSSNPSIVKTSERMKIFKNEETHKIKERIGNGP